jgi:hypothetical protein
MGDFLTWKFLHIATMFFAVALAVSTEVVMRRVAGSRDPRTIRIVAARLKPIGNLSTVVILGGVVFGILAALAGQIDLLTPWLISAYVAFIGAMVIGITITDPWVVRLEKAAAASPENEPSAELIEVVDDRRALIGTGALMVLIATLVFIMVVKPFR